MGHTILTDAQDADLAILNTCAVTSAAVSDSRQKIRKLQKSSTNQIIVTGCWSTLFPEEVPTGRGITQIILNEEKDHLTSILSTQTNELFDIEPIERHTTPGARMRTRAFVKVQDGCNNHCTFCITTIARGISRSLSIQEIHTNLNNYYFSNPNASLRPKEIVLTGVHLGSWGKDFNPPLHLRDLIQSILDNFDIPRFRLSSMEPWDIDSDFFKLWKDPRLCRHLHLPLQSGSQTTLRRMARKTSPQSFSNLVERARATIPDVAITTDLIAGFPGETQAEFEETIQFVSDQNFAGGHVFTYSPRPGTAAVRMPDQIPFSIRKDRNSRLRSIIEQSAHTYQSRFIGQISNVLWESANALGPDGWQISGLTDNYLRINTTTSLHIWNQITPVRVTRQTEKGIEGQIVTSQ
jgi:threonylcarbamoyladenosine tRNA methylthiotransferase MtaB